MLGRFSYFLLFLFLFLSGRGLLNAREVDTVLLNSSVNKALEYLNRRIVTDSIYYLGIPLLIPVGEYYHIPLDKKVYLVENRITDQRDKQMFLLYSCMFRETKLTKEHIPDLDLIDFINLFPVYGELICTEEAFLNMVDSSIKPDSYELTHVYFASLLLMKTKKIGEDKQKVRKKRIEKEMRKMLNRCNHAQYTDLEIEVIAMSLYGSLPVKKDRIVQLLDQQSEDGSWEQPGNTSSRLRDHSTILALWALLEWKFKEDRTLYLPFAPSTKI